MTKACGKNCKLCPNIIDINRNPIKTRHGLTVKAIGGGSCKTRNVIYAAWCKKHDEIYVGHTGDKLADRFSKHRYDIKSRPQNSELAQHFHLDHEDKDMKVFILQQDLPNLADREREEDRWICCLQTLQPKGINLDLHSYGREMYASFSNLC